MTARPTTPGVLGPQAETLIQRDVAALRAGVEPLDAAAWSAGTRIGDATIARVVEHLAEGADRFGDAVRRHYEDAEPGPLLQPFDDPSEPPAVDASDLDPGVVLDHYRQATDRLLHALSVTRQEDWAWPVWSPLGGLESLAEGARRWFAHHYVHRDDIHAALGRPADGDDDAARLVVEFVLDSVARRASTDPRAPITIEVVTSMPGAGSWVVVLGETETAPVHHDLWSRLGGVRSESLPDHRVDRGPADRARIRVTGSGETVWRAGFGRGARWEDLSIHADDEARDAWRAIVARSAPSGPRRVGRIQH